MNSVALIVRQLTPARGPLSQAASPKSTASCHVWSAMTLILTAMMLSLGRGQSAWMGEDRGPWTVDGPAGDVIVQVRP